MIATQIDYCNTLISKSTAKLRQSAAMASDSLTKLLNSQIEKGIESYIRTLSRQELEFVKYLYYYFKKWGGNIQIPIQNLCNRFKVSFRWVHIILARLYEKGLLLTIQGGYGRKITRRTFTERGLIVIKNLLPPEKINKHVIPPNCADYCADYSGGHTKYISSKGDHIQENLVPQEEKRGFKSVSDCISAMREMLNGRCNT